MNLEYLIKLSPLVVATLHGYGAAWLAVKMLFRPLHPVYLFGRRLPLTPGMLPKERERFIAALSKAIGEKLLNIEVIADELMKLDLGREIAALAQREYANYTGNETVLRHVTEHLQQRLYLLSREEEAKRGIVRRLRQIIDRETEGSGFLRRFAANHLLDEETLFGLTGKALEALADGVSESAHIRQTVSDALVQIPQKLLAGNGLVSSTAIGSLVETLSRKLDVRTIMFQRLSAFSNEDIEQLVMDTAGAEIRAIVWFGAGIGLIVGIVQTLINFI
ncbi:MAG: DUF445 domain-containing protein [Blastocatellia bacterium]